MISLNIEREIKLEAISINILGRQIHTLDHERLVS